MHSRSASSPRLTTEHWTTWKQTIDTLFTQAASSHHLLQTPLGRWHTDPTPNASWLFHHDSQSLLHVIQDTIEVWSTPRPARAGISHALYTHTNFTDHIPDGVSPASVIIGTNTVSLESFSCHGIIPKPTPPAPRPTLQGHTATVHPLDQWAVSELQSADNGAAIAQLIQEGQAIAVSDGSYDQGISTSAFVLTSRTKPTQPLANVTGSNVVPGNPSEQDSYRAELGGIMGILTALEIICNLHSITHGEIEIGLDGEGAYKVIFTDKWVKAKDKAYDLINAVRHKLSSLPLTIKGRHIHGHQDNKKAYAQLNRWEKLNVQVDKAAKRRLAAAKLLPLPGNSPLASERIVVYHKGMKLSRIDKKALYEEIYGQYTKAKWIKLHSIPEALINNITWKEVQKHVPWN